MKGNKQLIKRFSIFKLFKYSWIKLGLKKIYLSKYRRIHNNYICFNLPKLPYTKKSVNSRMGKGKGKIKNWFINIYSGNTLFYLLRWPSKIALFALKSLVHFLPSKNKLFVPSLKKNSSSFYSQVFTI